MGHVINRLLLVALCLLWGTAEAQKLYEKTAINPATTVTTTKSGSTLLSNQFGFLQQVNNGGSPTSIDNAYIWLMKGADNQDSNGSSDPGRSGGLYIDYTFGASAKRGKEAFAVNLTGVADQDAGVGNRNYVGITSYVQPVAMGGPDSSHLEGQWFGGNTNILGTAGPNAYMDSIIGWEHDIANQDATTGSVVGEKIIFTSLHKQRGVKQNVGMEIAGAASIASGNAGLDCGYCVGGYDGFWPMATTGSVFSDWANANLSGIGANIGIVANLIYFPSLTITGYAIDTPGFTVDGSGNVSATSISVGGAQFPYSFAQSSIPFILPGSATMGNNGALSGVAAVAAGTVTQAYVFAYPGTIGNATAASVTITGTAGQFACTCTGLVVGQYMKLSGTYGGTGSITGYSDPTTYYVTATNGTSTFTLVTVGRNGLTTTAGTPTGITYAAGGGWFYATGSSTTAYTLFNNLYVSGTPTVPASPTAFSTTGITAYTATISVAWPGPYYPLPGNSLGLNGGVESRVLLKYNNSANTKTLLAVLGSTTLLSIAPTATTFTALEGHMINEGSASVQQGWQQTLTSGATPLVTEQSAGATNTTTSQPLTFKLTLANTGDAVDLASHSIEVRPN